MAPCEPTVDREVAVTLGTKLARAFPALTTLPIANSWAGLRTFAADRLFVAGADPVVEGFYWAAGLGGHGVTTCGAIGALVAHAIVDPSSDAENPFSPSRLTIRSV